MELGYHLAATSKELMSDAHEFHGLKSCLGIITWSSLSRFPFSMAKLKHCCSSSIHMFLFFNVKNLAKDPSFIDDFPIKTSIFLDFLQPWAMPPLGQDHVALASGAAEFFLAAHKVHKGAPVGSEMSPPVQVSWWFLTLTKWYTWGPILGNLHKLLEGFGLKRHEKRGWTWWNMGIKHDFMILGMLSIWQHNITGFDWLVQSMLS